MARLDTLPGDIPPPLLPGVYPSRLGGLVPPFPPGLSPFDPTIAYGQQQETPPSASQLGITAQQAADIAGGFRLYGGGNLPPDQNTGAPPGLGQIGEPLRGIYQGTRRSSGLPRGFGDIAGALGTYLSPHSAEETQRAAEFASGLVPVGGAELGAAEHAIGALTGLAANRAIVAAGRVAENPAVRRLATEDIGSGRVNPFSGLGDLARRQLDNLRATGQYTEAEIQELAKTMAPAAEPRVGTVTGAGGETIYASKLTRALQSVVGSEGVPLSRNPVFAKYGAGSLPDALRAKHGGDIGTATRAVMANDQDAIAILGDNLTNELLQNNLASKLRNQGVSNEVLRRGFGRPVEASPVEPPPASPKVPPVSGSVPEDVPLIDRSRGVENAHVSEALRAQGATEAEIKAFLGDRYAPPAAALPPEIAPQSGLAREASPEVVNRAAAASQEMAAPVLAPRPPAGGGRIGGDVNAPNGALFSDNALPPIVRKFGPGVVGDVVNQIMYNGIIFVRTSLVHPFGSFLSSLGAAADKLSDVPLDAAANALGLTKNRYTTTQSVGDAMRAKMVAMSESIRHDLPDILQGGDSLVGGSDMVREVSAALARGEYGSGLAKKYLGVAGQVLSAGNMPQRMLAAIDNVFVRGGQAYHLMEQGFREAYSLGLRPGSVEAATYAKNFFDTAGNEARALAVELARTDINRQAPGKIASGVLRLKNEMPLGNVLLPFFNTRLNILKNATTWSPLGFGRLIPDGFGPLSYFNKGAVSEAERLTAVKRAMVGTLAAVPLWNYITDDKITGDGPTDARAKALWIGDPNHPSHVARSVRTPFGWVSYGKIPGFGDYLAGLADSAQAVRDGKDQDVSGKGAAALHGLLEFSYNEEQGIVNALDTIKTASDFWGAQDDPRAVADFAYQLASRGWQMTPYSGAQNIYTAANDTNTLSAPTIKGATGFGGVFQQAFLDYAARNPILNAGMPFRQGAERVPGVTGGLGSQLPVTVSGAPGETIGGTAAGMPPVAKAESDKLASLVSTFHPLVPPASKIGAGTKYEVDLRGGQYVSFAKYVGEARDAEITKMLGSKPYQNATPQQQAELYDRAVSAADAKGRQNYLKDGVIQSTDPEVIRSLAVENFNQYQTPAQKADWLSLLQQSGKLTPDVRAAIQGQIDARPALPGDAEKTNVDEYLRAAPIIHEYLDHAAYGTDARPIGTPADWELVGIYRHQLAVQTDALVRQNVNPVLAKQQAMISVLNSIQSPVQRVLFTSGAQVRNPARLLLIQKYGTQLSKFLPAQSAYIQGQ